MKSRTEGGSVGEKRLIDRY